MDEDTSTALELKKAFDSWYDSFLKPKIDDNRNRYMMILADAEERAARNLSALPSTKSLSVVDGYVENAILEYNQDPDAISFTSRSPGNPDRDKYAQILTEDFIYRKENTSQFHLWQEASLRSGAVDGLEAAFVRWCHESYTKPLPESYSLNGAPVPAEIYEQFKNQFTFNVENREQIFIVRDSWVIERLMPRRDVFWDPKIPVLDVNLGTFAGVMIPITLDEIMQYQEKGVFDAEFSQEDIEGMLSAQREGNDAARERLSPDSRDFDIVDLGDKNRAELMIFFEKRQFEWFVQFSLAGRLELSTFKPVNDVFYNGRPVNRLPIVVGYIKSRLWDATGVGFPEVIAPIEDELSDHRNNANDIAKQIAQGGRIRIKPDADVNIDQVLNARAFEAEKDDVEFMQYPTGLLEAMRLDDARSQDIASLVPLGIADRSRQLSLKGTTKGLGLNQMAEQDANAKLGVNLMLRNQTFFKPVLWLIAQLTIAFETDENILKIAARNAGEELPQVVRGDGRKIIDLSVFDFDVDVQINAGLGSMPRYKKAQNTIQIAQFRKAMGIPTDWTAMAGQLNVLAGFNATQFDTPAPPPPPPPVEYKATVNIDLAQLLSLAPEAAQMLLNKMMTGQMSVTAKVDGGASGVNQAEAEQNGTGMMPPERAATEAPDMTGEMGAAMSEGGMNG